MRGWALIVGLAGCAKSPQPAPDEFAALAHLSGAAFADKMQLLPELKIGQSRELSYVKAHLAIPFRGNRGEKIDLSVDSMDGDPTVWIVDRNWKTLLRSSEQDPGVNDLSFAPPESASYYLVLADGQNRPATFAVALTAPPSQP